MSDTRVVIVGVGMTTAVGLSAPQTATAVRAGVARLVATDLRDQRFEPFTLAEVPANALPPLVDPLEKGTGLTTREARMLRLATQPMREALTPLRTRGALPPMPLCLALPENETTRALDRVGFLRRLATQTGGGFDAEHSDASHAGRAGGVVAIGQAVATILSGTADFVLAGGIDSFLDLYVLGTLDMEGRVKSAVNRDGFVPGEGAAFLLLASARAAALGGLTILGAVSAVAIGYEPGHLYSPEPYRGDGLAATLAQLPAIGAATAPIEEVYSSMNGESHWAKEWGVGYLRNRRTLAEGFRMHHPADSYGDTGAASGPLMAGLAALGMAGQYRRSPALVYGSSDRGARAAMVITNS